MLRCSKNNVPFWEGSLMKKLVALCTERRFSTEVLKTALVLFVGIALGSGFWIASTPMAHGHAKLTPVEMIQAKLPQGKTIATASDAQLLEAVCKAVKQIGRASCRERVE